MIESGVENGRVLVVEDDEIFREILQKTLEDRKYHTLGLASVKKAIDAFDSYDPHYVVSDIELPVQSGFELLFWVKRNRPNVPVILVTGGKADAEDVLRKGASAFLTKPFAEDALIRTISSLPKPGATTSSSATLPASPPADASHHPDFVRVSLDDLLNANEVRHPIFIRFPTDQGIRFFKAAESSDKLSLQRLLNYKRKGGHSVYFQKRDHAYFVGFRLTVEADENGPKIPPAEKENFLGHSLGLLQGLAFSGEVSDDALNRGATLVESTIQLLTASDAGYRLLAGLKELSERIYAESIAVSLVSSMIARRMGWTSLRTLTRVALAGLLQDVGMLKLPADLAGKRYGQLEAGQKKTYECHPLESSNLLSEANIVPEDVILAVRQHHEKRDGSGFPRRATTKDIAPIAKILIVANEFCARLFDGAAKDARDAKAAVTQLTKEEEARINPDALVALHQIFDVALTGRLVSHAARSQLPGR